ncbi:MAG: hypothetical protein AABZ39_13130 [Spirochaetota bacterium]
MTNIVTNIFTTKELFSTVYPAWVGAVGSILAALGTIAAVIVALCLAFKQNRVQYKARSWVECDKNNKIPAVLAAEIINNGPIDITITGIYFFSKKRWWSLSAADFSQMSGARIPRTIKYGEAHLCSMILFSMGDILSQIGKHKIKMCFLSSTRDYLWVKLDPAFKKYRKSFLKDKKAAVITERFDG